MVDRKIRELARRAATGDLAASADLLRERVRSGEIAPGWLELLARLGDEAAIRALDLSDARIVPELPDPAAADAWCAAGGRPPDDPLAAMATWGQEASVRAVRACLRLTRAELARRLAGDPILDRLLELTDAWIDADEPARVAVAERVDALSPGPTTSAEAMALAMADDGDQTEWALDYAVSALQARSSEAAARDAQAIATSAARLLIGDHRMPGASHALVVAAIRTELRPWILTRREPPVGLAQLRLAQRLERGELSKVGVGLAASLGHEGARRLLEGKERIERLDGEGSLWDWTTRLVHAYPGALIPVGLVAARIGLAAWSARPGHDRRPGEAYLAARAWQRAPSSSRSEAALEAAGAAARAAAEAEGEGELAWGAEAVALVAGCCYSLAPHEPAMRRRLRSQRLDAILQAVARASDATGDDAAVRRAITTDLLDLAIPPDGRRSPRRWLPPE